jgi:hypothetical protein
MPWCLESFALSTRHRQINAKWPLASIASMLLLSASPFFASCTSWSFMYPSLGLVDSGDVPSATDMIETIRC